ncbi:hypothetical protein N4T20_05385 [Flavobacterium sp. TR2]|uniref:hypothetical protein n=1 Tax=Flavobacterium sp. TR2 TaxID=2977321 RepID=UPI0021B0E15F|nr:hypothetical protein [Flavobacterium sp. TR2]UWY29368.1 hypothetical protein N4T20_05385 [Flavobacterium sp. TR2]
MKNKITRIMLLTILFSLMACTKEADVLEPNLIGLYRYRAAHVNNPINMGNGYYYLDLTLIPGNECVFDNTWEFKADKLILREGETSCENDSQMISENKIIAEYDYIYVKENRTIKIFNKNILVETLRNVKLGYDDNKQTLYFDLWSDTADQIVNYYLEEK